MTSQITRPAASNWEVNRIQADMTLYEMPEMEATMTRLFSEDHLTIVERITFYQGHKTRRFCDLGTTH